MRTPSLNDFIQGWAIPAWVVIFYYSWTAIRNIDWLIQMIREPKKLSALFNTILNPPPLVSLLLVGAGLVWLYMAVTANLNKPSTITSESTIGEIKNFSFYGRSADIQFTITDKGTVISRRTVDPKKHSGIPAMMVTKDDELIIREDLK